MFPENWMMDYALLRLIWWGLLGVLLIGFAVMDGFDLGSAILSPFIAKSDTQRRIILNTVGPFWEGNQVWLILGAGAIFAAWPLVYAVAFSGFYLAMLLALLALILRPVGFDYRAKIDHPRWRLAWDIGLFIAGFVPALVFGVAVGNVLLGVPFHFDADQRMIYTGGLLQLFSPFALLCGACSVMMLAMQGAAWLMLKTRGELQARARRAGFICALALLALFTLGGLWLASINGYGIDGAALAHAPSNPQNKQVSVQAGLWLHNYARYPLTLAAPVLVYAGVALFLLCSLLRRHGTGFIASSAAVAGVVATAGVSLFPFLLPSSSQPSHSLTVWDASSSQNTLFIMLLATLLFMPIIIVYTSWVYRVMRGPVKAEHIEKGSGHYY